MRLLTLPRLLTFLLTISLFSTVNAQWIETSNQSLWWYNGVGIGTSNPQAGLHVSGMHIAVTAPDMSTFLYFLNNQIIAWNSADVNGIMFGSTTNLSMNGYVEKIRFTNDGCIAINTTVSNGYKLNVNGNARANQITVNTTGADYVFDSTYHLPTLTEVKAYVEKNHHLEGIAPAAEMAEKGVNLGENQTQMLRKIEELTLYVIDLNKKQEALTRADAQLQAENARLQSEVDALKNKKKK
jgi:hypothetical protein